MAFGHMATLNSIVEHNQLNYLENNRPSDGGVSPRMGGFGYGFEMFGQREKSTIDASDMISITDSINFDRNSNVFNKSPDV